MKQVFHNKGSTVDTKGARQTTDAFENFYEFTGTGLKKFPVPNDTARGHRVATDEGEEEFARRRQGAMEGEGPEQDLGAVASLREIKDLATELDCLARELAACSPASLLAPIQSTLEGESGDG
jgi:hypothetical protein